MVSCSHGRTSTPTVEVRLSALTRVGKTTTLHCAGRARRLQARGRSGASSGRASIACLVVGTHAAIFDSLPAFSRPPRAAPEPLGPSKQVGWPNPGTQKDGSMTRHFSFLARPLLATLRYKLRPVALPRRRTDSPTSWWSGVTTIGWQNVSAYGVGTMGYTTPNIDRIGAEGIRFTDHYAQPSAIRTCSPASPPPRARRTWPTESRPTRAFGGQGPR